MTTAVVKKTDLEIALTGQDYKDYLKQILGSESKANQFANNMLCLASNDYQLQKCDTKELINAGLQATTINLPLNKSLGKAYVIAYKGHAQFQIGYKGLIEIARRSGKYRYINAVPIHDKSELKSTSYKNGLADDIIDIKMNRYNKGLTEPIGYLARIEEVGGFAHELFMTKKECEEHGKKYSQAYSFIWQKEFDKMALKTVLKLLLSQFGDTSNEALQKALVADQGIIKNYDTQEVDYIDNPQNQSSEVVEAEAEVVDECPYKTEAEARQRLIEIVSSNLFDEEEKAWIKTNWSKDWKQTIIDTEATFELKNNAMMQSKTATFQ